MSVTVNEKHVNIVTGTVVSDKMDKGIVVLVVRQVKHPKYGKYIKRSTRLHAHDEKNDASVGDVVSIKECKPISKTKNWVLVEIKEKAKKE
jgi:small subunit ribosomal protein S17